MEGPWNHLCEVVGCISLLIGLYLTLAKVKQASRKRHETKLSPLQAQIKGRQPSEFQVLSE